MGKIFDINNPFWAFVGRLVDVCVLHVLWLICCVPIVTIGPSTAAIYYAMMKDVSDENPHYVRMFFKSFKENMKQGMGIGMIMVVAGLMIAYALYYYYQMAANGTFWAVIFCATILMAVLYVFVAQYIFALLARFSNTTKNLFTNAFFMSIRHIGWTILMVVILVIVYSVIFGMGFFPLITLGFGLVVLLDSYILNHVFKPYIKEIIGEVQEKDPDAWELPEEITEAPENETAEETSEPEEKEEPAETGSEEKNE